MDFVINHSSDQHPWFEKSIDRVEPYTDFYVWANPKGYNKNGTPMPPNNWVINISSSFCLSTHLGIIKTISLLVYI